MRKSSIPFVMGLLATIGAACWFDARSEADDAWWPSAPKNHPVVAPSLEREPDMVPQAATSCLAGSSLLGDQT